MIEFNFIPQQEIRNWWATIKPGLDEIKLKSPEPWIVEDVYVDLFNQKSMLWIALENKHFAGFFVLQPLGHELHIWAAWTVENDYIIKLNDEGKEKYYNYFTNEYHQINEVSGEIQQSLNQTE